MANIYLGTARKDIYADAWNCPFCNNNKLEIRSEDWGGGYSKYYVYCPDCNAHGPLTDYTGANLKQKAVDLWNKWRDLDE